MVRAIITILPPKGVAFNPDMQTHLESSGPDSEAFLNDMTSSKHQIAEYGSGRLRTPLQLVVNTSVI